MIFDAIDIKTLDAAAQRYLANKGNLEARESLLALNDAFHSSTKWEAICGRVEDMTLKLFKKKLAELSGEESGQFHVYLMGLLSVGFAAGYEAAFQATVDDTVKKYGGLA